MSDDADQVGQAGEEAPHRQAVLAAAVYPGEDAPEVVSVEHLRLIDDNHDAEVCFGHRRRQVDDDIGERFPVGMGVSAIEAKAAPGDRQSD
ncbi:MAG: hypothetical protein ACR2MB_13600 [Acidimicrobiales bacterium]